MSITVREFSGDNRNLNAVDYLATILVPDYFPEYTAGTQTSTSHPYTYYADAEKTKTAFYCEGQVVTISSSQYSQLIIRLYKSNSSYVTITGAASTSGKQFNIQKVISCDGGVLVICDYGGFIITRSNNGGTVIIANSNNTINVTNANQFKWSGVSSITYGDDTSSNARLSFTGTEHTQTQMVPFITKCPYGDVSYTPDAFWIPFGEFYSVTSGRFIGPDDMVYITNGYWAVRDYNSLE